MAILNVALVLVSYCKSLWCLRHSGAGQFYVEGANFGGLSGVVYALLGYLWVLGYRLPHLGLTLPKSIIGFMLAWLVLGFVQPFMAIANTAHLAGFVGRDGDCAVRLGQAEIPTTSVIVK